MADETHDSRSLPYFSSEHEILRTRKRTVDSHVTDVRVNWTLLARTDSHARYRKGSAWAMTVPKATEMPTPCGGIATSVFSLAG